MSAEEYGKIRVSWDPHIRDDEVDPMLEYEFEGMDSEEAWAAFRTSAKKHVELFDDRSDHLEPEDDSIEREFLEKEKQSEKVLKILEKSHRRDSRSKEADERVQRLISIRRRDRSFIPLLKELYDYRCQICGTLIACPSLKAPGYVEGHHIRPLENHGSPDIIENVIIVCPNHHKELEYGGTRLDLKLLDSLRHPIAEEFVDYHNREISLV